MGSGTVVTVSLDPKRVQEIERAGGRGAAVRPETEQPTYPLPGAFAQQPMATQQMPPLGYSQQFPQQYQQGYQQPYQQMPQQQYNPWAQQMRPQPYQQWPQSFQQQMPTVQSSQQPAAQMMYPNAANQYAQPQPDVFVSDRGNAALGYLAQNQACGATDLARAFGNSAPTWSRTLNDLAQAGLVIKHGQKYHLTELGAARVRAQG